MRHVKAKYLNKKHKDSVREKSTRSRLILIQSRLPQGRVSPQVFFHFLKSQSIFLFLFSVSTPALVGICLAATVFLVGVFAVTCFCKRGRQSEYGGHGFLGKKYKLASEKPLAFHHKKPTAVKSPAGNSHYLKKSPSPTGGKSPPGVSQ